MPYGYDAPAWPLIPSDQWGRDDWNDPSIASAPFGFAPPIANPTPRATASVPRDGFATLHPLVQAILRSASPPQPNDDASRLGSFAPAIPDGNAPFSLAPSLAPNEWPPSADNQGAFGLGDTAVQPASLRGWARSRPGQGPITPIPPGPFDWQAQTEQAAKAWWDNAVRGHQGLTDFTTRLLRGIINGFDPLGNSDALRRCLEAAAGSTDDWNKFCDSIGSEQNNVVGGQSARKACFSKTYESRTNKINWCNNQFGDGIPTSD